MTTNTDDIINLSLTAEEIKNLSTYFIDKDNDIEGYDIDQVVKRINTLAENMDREENESSLDETRKRVP